MSLDFLFNGPTGSGPLADAFPQWSIGALKIK
jgi:hypothetical protein